MEYNAFDTQACVCIENKQINKNSVHGLIWNNSKQPFMSAGVLLMFSAGWQLV